MSPGCENSPKKKEKRKRKVPAFISTGYV